MLDPEITSLRLLLFPQTENQKAFENFPQLCRDGHASFQAWLSERGEAKAGMISFLIDPHTSVIHVHIPYLFMRPLTQHEILDAYQFAHLDRPQLQVVEKRYTIIRELIEWLGGARFTQFDLPDITHYYLHPSVAEACMKSVLNNTDTPISMAKLLSTRRKAINYLLKTEGQDNAT
jgi:hypothetical protein